MKKFVLSIALITLLCPVFAKTTGIMLRTMSPLRVDNGKGGAEWSIEVPAGTAVEVESETPVTLTLITSEGSTPDVQFVKVKYQKKSYVAKATEIVIGGTLSVSLKDTGLYLKPAVSSFLNATLDKWSFVVTGKSVDKNGVNFKEIKYWSDSAWEIRTRYVLSDAISVKADDVKAIQILDKISEVKEDNMKKTLIDTAKKLSVSDVVLERVETKYKEIYGISDTSSEVTIDAEDMADLNVTGTVSTDDGSKLNVRSIPGKEGDVVGQLDSDSEVTVLAKEKKVVSIDGIESSWYQVSDGTITGWIFGGYLKLN